MTAVHVFNILAEARERPSGRSAASEMDGDSSGFLLDAAGTMPGDLPAEEVSLPIVSAEPAADEIEQTADADSLDVEADNAIIAGDPLTRILEGWTGMSARSQAGPRIDETEHPGTSVTTKTDMMPDSGRHLLAALTPDAAADETTLFVDDPADQEPENLLSTPAIRETALSTSATTRQAPSIFQTATQQVAEALIRMTGDRLEIALSPEELGQLRIVVSHRDGMAHLLVWAERPEILDLMRRNASMLQNHFAEAGTDLASMEFSSGSEQNETVVDQNAGEGQEQIIQVPLAAANPGKGVGQHRVDMRL